MGYASLSVLLYIVDEEFDHHVYSQVHKEGKAPPESDDQGDPDGGGKTKDLSDMDA